MDLASGHTHIETIAIADFMPHPRRVEKHVALKYMLVKGV
jgi:hypothetical protein